MGPEEGTAVQRRQGRVPVVHVVGSVRPDLLAVTPGEEGGGGGFEAFGEGIEVVATDGEIASAGAVASTNVPLPPLTNSRSPSTPSCSLPSMIRM